MRVSRVLAIVLAGFVVAIGLVGLASPSTLYGFGRSLDSRTDLYVVAALRIVFGILLLRVASTSRMPRTVRVIGVVVLVAGLVTPFFGIERAHRMIEWLFGQGPLLVRAWGGIAAFVGLFLIYAVAAPRNIQGE